MAPSCSPIGASLLLLWSGAALAQAGGAIRWEPYRLAIGESEAEAAVGRLQVPEDPSEPNGPRITLTFVRLAATGPISGPPIVYLAGGPGGSGIGDARIPAMAELFTALRRVGDVILLDQRGTGLASPNLACRDLAPPPDLFLSEETFRRALREGLEACAADFRAQGVRLEHYTSRASAADIEALRRALGVERVSLLGFSYGTHLGLATLRYHPAAVHRAVLMGVEGPDDSEKLPSTADLQLRRLARFAREDSVIGRLAPDLAATFRALVERLDREPARVRLPRSGGDSADVPIGGFGMRYILLRDLGDTHDWPILPGLIMRTAQGDHGLLTQFARRRWQAAPSVMWAAMDCASGGSPERRQQVAREARASVFGDAMNLLDDATCRAVGAADLGDEYRSRLWSDVPTLFVSGSLDYQTPPYQAETVRWGFPRSAHIVVEHAGHESTFEQPEVQRLIGEFLGGTDVGDRRIVLPRPVFRGPGRR
jgi:pimeloyl-ACP methyl ester carboxylesterase